MPEKSAVDPFPLPACWDGHEVFGADGKAIKHVKRLLKPLRGLQAGILGARASVALNLRTGMAVGMVGHLDGEAGEGPLTEGLLSKMAAAAGVKPWVVVLDRLYCNLGLPKAGSGGRWSLPHPLLLQYSLRRRSHSTGAGEPRCTGPANRAGVGAVWASPRELGALQVRRITLYLADGQVISVITDLLDEAAYPAEDMLATYQKRWGIERVFHQITDVFSLKNLIGSSPRAVLFQMSFCLLLYNTLQVVRAHLASHQECEAEKISNEKLFYDMKRELVSVDELVEKASLLELLGEAPTSGELRDYLRENLRGVWSNRWWKAPSSRGGGHKKVEDARAWQSYVDLPGPSASKNMNKTVLLYLPETLTALPCEGGEARNAPAAYCLLSTSACFAPWSTLGRCGLCFHVWPGSGGARRFARAWADSRWSPGSGRGCGGRETRSCSWRFGAADYAALGRGAL